MDRRLVRLKLSDYSVSELKENSLKNIKRIFQMALDDDHIGRNPGAPHARHEFK
jgi:hypothetical protein